MVLVLLGLCGASTARAQGDRAITDVHFELAGDAVRMTGNVRFTLSDAVQETLSKGVPVYFEFETRALRSRWYWMDKTVHTHTRYMRLAYLPLTRKWRVNSSTEPLNRGVAGVALNQNFDSLQAALAVIQRISNWQVMDRSDWSNDGEYVVEARFRLDTSLLQLPLQIGNSAQSDWSLDIKRQFRLTQQDLQRPAGS